MRNANEPGATPGLPDAVLVSVGGGGLIAGLAAGFEGRAPIIALEPELAPTLFQARRQGQPVDVEVAGIAADSLGARRIRDITWDLTQQWVSRSLLLSDDAIRAANRRLCAGPRCQGVSDHLRCQYRSCVARLEVGLGVVGRCGKCAAGGGQHQDGRGEGPAGSSKIENDVRKQLCAGVNQARSMRAGEAVGAAGHGVG